MLALGGGVAALVLGIIGIIFWWGYFIDLLMGAIPLMLILGGGLATYLGVEEIRDKMSADTFDTSPPQFGQEAESSKEEKEESQKEEESKAEK